MSGIIKENIQLQMEELEMLFSMFPNKGEITLQDENTLPNVQKYLNNASENIPHPIEYSVVVTIDEPKSNISSSMCLGPSQFAFRRTMNSAQSSRHFEDIVLCYWLLQVQINLQVTLPQDYPQMPPQLFARSDALDRKQQLQLNKDITSYITSLETGELCIFAAVQWLRDNSTPYLKNSKVHCEREPNKKVVKTLFTRMWIYSHHIYRQELRKKIFDCAKKLNLTGFCLTGKPGIICVEGIKENCEEFWHVVRYPNWKHISCKHVESVETEGNGDNLHLFHTFEDLQFQAHGDYGLRNDYHMDLGQFLEFLKAHQSEHIFQILFGIEGKCSDN